MCQAFGGAREAHERFALGMLGPIVMTLIFTFPHFIRLERRAIKKVWPLLLLMLWPQYRAARIIFLGMIMKDKRWKKEKDIFQKNLSSIGKIFHQETITAYF